MSTAQTAYYFLGRHTGQEIRFIHEIDALKGRHRLITTQPTKQEGPWQPINNLITFQLGTRQWVFQLSWPNMPTAFEVVMPVGYSLDTMNPTEGVVR